MSSGSSSLSWPAKIPVLMPLLFAQLRALKTLVDFEDVVMPITMALLNLRLFLNVNSSQVCSQLSKPTSLIIDDASIPLPGAAADFDL